MTIKSTTNGTGERQVGLLVKAEHRPDVELIFDSDTMLLKCCRWQYVDPADGSLVRMERQFADYKVVDRIMWASRSVLYRDGVRLRESTLVELQLEDEVEDSLFQKP
jgi:hypothetical protein